MSWYIWTSLAALLFCVVILGKHFMRLLKHGPPKDLSQKSGNIAHAICYSCIGAMSPMQKESAHLHLPTYTAGIFFHIGNFLAIDVYCFTGHKCLMGPTGIGGSYVREGIEIKHTRAGGTGVRSAYPVHLDEYPYRLEYGTLNLLGFAGLNAGVKWIQETWGPCST